MPRATRYLENGYIYHRSMEAYEIMGDDGRDAWAVRERGQP